MNKQKILCWLTLHPKNATEAVKSERFFRTKVTYQCKLCNRTWSVKYWPSKLGFGG